MERIGGTHRDNPVWLWSRSSVHVLAWNRHRVLAMKQGAVQSLWEDWRNRLALIDIVLKRGFSLEIAELALEPRRALRTQRLPQRRGASNYPR